MSRSLLAAIALAGLAFPALAQQGAALAPGHAPGATPVPPAFAGRRTTPPPGPPVVVDARLAALRDDALATDHYAWDIVEGLTTEVGQRLAGTPAEARARGWAVRRLTALGFANVHVERFPIPVWTRGTEAAEILAPFPQRMVVTALGNSASTGAGGITGQIVPFNSVDELRATPDAAVRGKIVFIDHNMQPTQDGSSYGQFGAPRRQGPTVASLKGALAIVVRSIGTDHHRNPHAGVQTFGPGANPIPAGALSVNDAEQMVRILKRGQPVTMHLTLVSEQRQGESGNVVAEVPGRDRDAPVLLVGGHLDSWDLGTGAIDDAAGVAITTAAAKRIMDAGQPLRTIRVVWFGDEESGGFGGAAYARTHGREPHAIAAESDFGADRVWRFGSSVAKSDPALFGQLSAALAPLGIVRFDEADPDGTDVEPTIALGAPWLSLNQDGTRYFDYHHTPDDTLDKIDPVQLRQNVAAWTASLALLSGGITEPKRSARR